MCSSFRISFVYQCKIISISHRFIFMCSEWNHKRNETNNHKKKKRKTSRWAYAFAPHAINSIFSGRIMNLTPINIILLAALFENRIKLHGIFDSDKRKIYFIIRFLYLSARLFLSLSRSYSVFRWIVSRLCSTFDQFILIFFRFLCFVLRRFVSNVLCTRVNASFGPP